MGARKERCSRSFVPETPRSIVTAKSRPKTVVNYFFLTFCVLLVEGSDVKCVCGVDLSPWRDEGRRVLLLVDLVPVHAGEERVLLKLVRAVAFAAQPLVHVTLENKARGNKTEEHNIVDGNSRQPRRDAIIDWPKKRPCA